MGGGLRLNTVIASSPMNWSGPSGGLNYKSPPLRPVNLRFNNINRRLLPLSDTAVGAVLSSTVGGVGGGALFTQQHIRILSFTACAAAVSATWLFCSAIPALMALQRAAESMEKLILLTTDELPGTMASIRLSGAEISDLTMELSDVGQELTQSVRNSTRFVRVVEENLTKLTMNPSMVEKQKPKAMKNVVRKEEPDLARTARGIRHGIVKGRDILQTLFTFIRFSKIALNYLRTRALAKAKGQQA